MGSVSSRAPWVALLVVGVGCGSSTAGTPDAAAENDGSKPTREAGAAGDSRTEPRESGHTETGSTDARGTKPDAGAPAGLAAKYVCDEGIDKDPAVIFSEAFDETSVGAFTARYDEANDPAGMVFVNDVPVAGCGTTSLKLTSSSSANATDFYKAFPGTDELFVRWYVKYQAGVAWHHTGVWFGGYDPSTPYPNPMAGLKPNGDDRFEIAIEPVYGIGAKNPRFDFYNYWMQMHSWMDVPMGSTAYYGNALVHQNAFTADDDTWMCMEAHAKMNTDLSSTTGAELDVWKNDVLVIHFDDAKPLGYWIKDKFCPEGADGTECTDYPPPSGTKMIPLDLQWRSVAGLKLNYVWPQNYITAGDGSVEFDAMVVATARIGCMQP